MNIGNVTAQQVSVLVWTASARTITGLPLTNYTQSLLSQTSGVSSVFSAWTQILASTAIATAWLVIVVTFRTNAAASEADQKLSFGVGPAGSEVEQFEFDVSVAGNSRETYTLPIMLLIPKSSRLAFRSSTTDANSSTVSLCYVGVGQ